MDALEDQMLLILFPALTWSKGYYFFRNEEVIHYDRNSLRPADLSPFVSLGDKILKQWSWVGERIKNFDIIPTINADIEVLPPGVQISPQSRAEGSPVVLTPEQDRAYNFINGVYNVQQIITACHQFPWFTLNALIDMDDIGLISIQVEEKPSSFKQFQRLMRLQNLRESSRYVFVAAAILSVIVLFKFIPPTFRTVIGSHSSADEMKFHAKSRIDQIRFAVASYRFAHGNYPDFLSELEEERYISEELLIDPWGAKFIYKKARLGYEVICGGPDRQWATDDDILFKINLFEGETGNFFGNWNLFVSAAEMHENDLGS
jgi:hypothetical protein